MFPSACGGSVVSATGEAVAIIDGRRWNRFEWHYIRDLVLHR